jgi:hypothetical protein
MSSDELTEMELTRAAQGLNLFIAQYTVHCTAQQHAMSSHELHRGSVNSVQCILYNVQTRNTTCRQRSCTEIEQLLFTVHYTM